MKRPSFQFYPADWRNNAKLRRCSEAARGVWMDVMCVLHDSDEYGVCRWPLTDLARAAGAQIRLVKELAEKDVLKGADKTPAPFIYTPRHAGKDGEPVTLVATDSGPCWYSSRLVRDEWVRLRRGSGTQFTADNQPPKNTPKPQPKVGIGDRQGYGPTSTSTSTLTSKEVALSNSGTAERNSEISNPGTKAGEICKALRNLGMASVSPSHPELLAMINKGVTLDMFEDAATKTIAKSKGFSYMLAILKGQLQEAADIEAGPGVEAEKWDTNRQTIEAMGVRVGVGKWDETAVVNREPFAAYVIRVRQAMTSQEVSA